MMNQKLMLQLSLGLLTAFASSVYAADVERIAPDEDVKPYGGAQEYMDKVADRRAQFGNKDGLRHSTLLNGNRLGFSLGYMSWTNGFKANGPHFGINYLTSFSDNVAMEMSGSYGLGTNEVDTAGIKTNTSVGRADIILAVRGQKVINLGDAQRALVPFLAVGPAYSHLNMRNETLGSAVSSSDSSIGFSIAPGIELLMGGMSMGLRANYIVSQSLATGGGDTSVIVPQFTAGWAF